MFLTKRQKEILDAQKPIARSQQIPHQRLGIHDDTLHSTNTYIFKNFLEALDVMTDPDNFETFKGRFKKNESYIWNKSRELRNLLKEAVE